MNRSRCPPSSRSAVASPSLESYDSLLKEEPTLPSVGQSIMEGSLFKVAKAPISASMETSTGVPDNWPVSDWVPINFFRSSIIPSLQGDQPKLLWTWQIEVIAPKNKLARCPRWHPPRLPRAPQELERLRFGRGELSTDSVDPALSPVSNFVFLR